MLASARPSGREGSITSFARDNGGRGGELLVPTLALFWFAWFANGCIGRRYGDRENAERAASISGDGVSEDGKEDVSGSRGGERVLEAGRGLNGDGANFSGGREERLARVGDGEGAT